METIPNTHEDDIYSIYNRIDSKLYFLIDMLKELYASGDDIVMQSLSIEGLAFLLEDIQVDVEKILDEVKKMAS